MGPREELQSWRRTDGSDLLVANGIRSVDGARRASLVHCARLHTASTPASPASVTEPRPSHPSHTTVVLVLVQSG